MSESKGIDTSLKKEEYTVGSIYLCNLKIWYIVLSYFAVVLDRWHHADIIEHRPQFLAPASFSATKNLSRLLPFY